MRPGTAASAFTILDWKNVLSICFVWGQDSQFCIAAVAKERTHTCKSICDTATASVSHENDPDMRCFATHIQSMRTISHQKPHSNAHNAVHRSCHIHAHRQHSISSNTTDATHLVDGALINRTASNIVTSTHRATITTTPTIRNVRSRAAKESGRVHAEPEPEQKPLALRLKYLSRQRAAFAIGRLSAHLDRHKVI